MKEQVPELKALQESADRNRALYEYSEPAARLLEWFPSVPGGQVEIFAPEFTSLCPLTGQPDFANIYVRYVADNRCVESKSFKLYLMSFRQYGSFHEAIVRRIFDDLWALLNPQMLLVRGNFVPRGGVAIVPEIVRDRRS